MRSLIHPFKIFTPIILFTLLFSSQNILAQSGWQSTFSNNVFIINKIIKRDSLNYFAFSSSSKNFLKSIDGGNNWISSPELALDSMYNIYDSKFLNTNTGWIVGSTVFGDLRGIFFKTTDGGQNWIKKMGITTYGYFSICFTDENIGWIGSWGGAAYSSLLKTTNGGDYWIEIPVPQTYQIRHANFFDSNYGWILNYSGYLCKTTNGGNNWISDSTFKYHYLYDLTPVTQNECWVLARDGAPASRLYKTTNGGMNWDLKLTTSNLFGELKFFDSQTAFVYGGKVLFKTTNGGNSWDSIYINSSYTLNSILPDKNVIVAGGGQNITFPPQDVNTHVNIVKTSNAGVNWSQNYYNRNYNFIDISFKDFQNGLAIENKGLIFKTTNGGNNWIKIYENPTYSMSNIKSLNDTNVLIFRTNGHFLRTNNYGNNWYEVISPVNDYADKVNFLNELTGYLIGGTQYIQKTTNGGLNWDSIKVPVNDIPFPGAFGYSGISFINESTGWLTAAGGLVVGGHGTIHINAIKKTTNGGLNWSIMFTSGSSTQFTRIKFFDANTGWSWVGNTIYQTTNSGSNWTIYSQNSTFTYQYLFMLNNTTGWMIGTDGPNNAICKTTNTGLNWFLQSTNGTGYSKYFTSLFIKDSDNLWACGGMNSIYKTTNGGGIISAIDPISSNIPEQFSLKQNYPNPFNPTTKINFDLKNTAFAMLRVYDITGREVRTLVNEKLLTGSYSYDFNASELPSGVYFYQLKTDGFIETKKMMLLK